MKSPVPRAANRYRCGSCRRRPSTRSTVPAARTSSRRRRSVRLSVLLLLGCGAAVPDPVSVAVPVAVAEPVTVAAAAPAKKDDLELCVEEINRYRGRAKKPALVRSAELEEFAAAGAKADGAARQAHRHFSRVAYPHPYREMGENEIPWWPLAQYGGVAEVIRAG